MRPLLLLALSLSTAALAPAIARASTDHVAVAHASDARLRTSLAHLDAQGFPVVADDAVTAHYTRFTASPRGRIYGQDTLESRRALQAIVDDALADWDLPPALAAVPFIESGYRNVDTSANSRANTAGIWQFVPATARAYGLVISGDVDERRDVRRSTDAACAYLTDLHDQFGDWGLALAAYNAGPTAVRRAMRDQGTDDISALIASGALNDYAAMVFAAALVLDDPIGLTR